MLCLTVWFVAVAGEVVVVATNNDDRGDDPDGAGAVVCDPASPGVAVTGTAAAGDGLAVDGDNPGAAGHAGPSQEVCTLPADPDNLGLTGT